MKKMRKSYTIVISLLATVALAVTGCGPGSTSSKGTESPQASASAAASASASTPANDDAKEPVTLSVLIPQAKFKEAQKKIAAQLKEKENITLDFQVVPDDQAINLIRTKLATKEAPDIIEFNLNNNLDQLNADNFVDLSGESWVQNLVNPDLIKNVRDGKIYGFPIESSQGYLAVWYNKKVFDELRLQEPNTYAEFTDILEQIKNSGKDITPFYEANKDPWTSQIFMTEGFAAALYPDKTKDTFEGIRTNKVKHADVPEFKHILELYKELYDKGYVNKDHLSATYDMSQTALGTGKAAMLLNGEFIVNAILAKYPDAQLGSFIIPFNDRKVLTTGTYVNGYLIPKDAKNIDTARKVLGLLAQPEYADIYFNENPSAPGIKNLNGGNLYPAIKSLVDQYIASGNYTAEYNDSIGIGSTVNDQQWNLYIDMILKGGPSPDKVLQNWDKIYSGFMKSKDQPGF